MTSFPGLVATTAIALTLLYPVARAQDLPKADPPFTGTTDIDVRKSSPAWPEAPTTITANIDVPGSGAGGVIFSQGSRYGGTTLYVNDNRVIYEINAYGNRSGQIVASEPLPPGKSHIVADVTPEFASTWQAPGEEQPRALPATATLTINNKAEGTGHFLNVNVHTSETLDIGSDLGSPVSPEYRSPSRFTGRISSVTIQLKK